MAAKIQLFEQTIRIIDFGLDLTSLHIGTRPLIEDDFLSYYSLDIDYFLVKVHSIHCSSVQPVITFQIYCSTNQIHDPYLQSVLIFSQLMQGS